LACAGGVPGTCFKHVGPWSNRSVQCQPLEDGLNGEAAVREGQEAFPALPPTLVNPTGYGGLPSFGAKAAWDEIEDYRQLCLGGDEAEGQADWLAAAERHSPERLAYLKGVYGEQAAGLEGVDARHVRFYWNSAPNRSAINVTWWTTRCAILGYLREGQLIAYIDDAKYSPSLLTPPMIERCEPEECDADCPQPLRPLRVGEGGATGPSLQELVRLGSSTKRFCLAATLDAFISNLSTGISFIDGHSSWGFELSAASGYPPLPYTFPGFFVVRDLFPQGPVAADPPFPVGMPERGLPDHTWVEVMRISRLDDKTSREVADRSQVGQVWFWLASGSGIWWNTGRSLVINININITAMAAIDGGATESVLSSRACVPSVHNADDYTNRSLLNFWRMRDERLREFTCKRARAMGYDSMQLTSSFCGFSWELVDCRGIDRSDAAQTWTAACPPPHVQMLRGLPEPRVAPAVAHVTGPSSPCFCETGHNFLNCAASR